jgi:hypothetical protein
VPLAVEISSANLNDCKMLAPMLDLVRDVQDLVGRPRRRPDKLQADKGYDRSGILSRRLSNPWHHRAHLATRNRIESQTRSSSLGCGADDCLVASVSPFSGPLRAQRRDPSSIPHH